MFHVFRLRQRQQCVPMPLQSRIGRNPKLWVIGTRDA